MRLRIRTLLLTVALLCSLTSTGRAGIYCPILNPFYWLFGGCGGYGGGDYGSMNTGNNYGHGPNPYGVSRCIDDWLGYGYLRNQEGTLGHYPGRPFSCYNPAFPCLLNPCSWFASCPLFAPLGTGLRLDISDGGTARSPNADALPSAVAKSGTDAAAKHAESLRWKLQ